MIFPLRAIHLTKVTPTYSGLEELDMNKKSVATLASSAQWIECERIIRQALCELRQGISELRRLSASGCPPDRTRCSKQRGMKGKSKRIRTNGLGAPNEA